MQQSASAAVVVRGRAVCVCRPFPVPAVFFVWLVAGLCGCGATVSVPPVENGLGVALVDHGRHASLVLETEERSMIRYAYGDWRYYALTKQATAEASRAALLPTTAGLGWRQWFGSLDRLKVAERLRQGAEEIYVFQVDRGNAVDLITHLDSIYISNLATLHENRVYDLSFVHHPQAYTLFNNSNRKVAEWLKRLGCAVSGAAISSGWKVRQ